MHAPEAAWPRRAADAIDARLLPCEPLLRHFLQRGHTATFWDVWSKAVQEGLLDAMDVQGPARVGFQGHGKPRVEVQRRPAWDTEAARATAADTQGVVARAEITRAIKQRRRYLALAALVRARKVPAQREWPPEVEELWESTRRHETGIYTGATPGIPHASGWHRVFVLASLAASAWLKHSIRLVKAESVRRRALLASRCDGPRGDAMAYKLLAAAAPCRLTFLDAPKGSPVILRP